MPLSVQTHAQKIIGASPTPGLILDQEGTILCANRSFLDIYDLKNAGEAVGQNAAEFLHDGENLPRLLNVVLDQGQWSGELLGKKKGGEALYLSVEAQRLQNGIHPPLIATFGTVSLSVSDPLDGPAAHGDGPVGTISLIGGAPALDEIHEQLKADGYGSERLTAFSDAMESARSDRWDVAVVEVPADGDEESLSLLSQLSRRPGHPRTLCLHPDISAATAMRLMRIAPGAFCHMPHERDRVPGAVRGLMRAARFQRFAENTSRVLRNWLDGNALWMERAGQDSRGVHSMSCQWYVEYAHRQIHRIFGNIRQLTVELLGGEQPLEACSFFRCPRLDELTAITEQTITILEKTRKSFKSTELAKLRKNLEMCLKRLNENDLP